MWREEMNRAKTEYRLCVCSLWLACCLFTAACVQGCVRERLVVVPESKAVYLIPAGTPFRARVVKGGPLVEIVRDKDTWCMDAGRMLELSKEANREALELPE